MIGSGVGGSDQLNDMLVVAGLKGLNSRQIAQFETYLELILKWNGRMNLTAIRDRMGILTRHFIECIACAQVLPQGLASVLDFGSGAGFPGVPIALCRQEIHVTLAESQSKKAAFLNEVVRELQLNARVYAGRAESNDAVFDCVALRAVDRMADAVGAASHLVSSRGILTIMTTEECCQGVIRDAGPDFNWADPAPLPNSEHGVIMIGNRIQTSVPRGTF